MQWQWNWAHNVAGSLGDEVGGVGILLQYQGNKLLGLIMALDFLFLATFFFFAFALA